MTFDEFVAPVGEARFLAEAWGRQPVHLKAAPGTPRAGGFGWARMNELFAIAPHWTPGNLRLILNSRPIDTAFYMDEVQTQDGPAMRADPAKVDLFLGMGASLVANDAQAIAPEIGAITDMLAARFTAVAGANIYCSFDGIQAFGTHYDTHEVFALQCEGEKVWRLYRNRAANAADHPPSGPEGQARIDAARGPLAAEITTRPGDLLYIPRGFYHDALARQGASMHITFAVAPATGRLVGRLLGEMIAADPAFGAYLPPVDEADGKALSARLAELAERAAATIRSPAFATAIGHAQRRSAVPRHRPALPARPATRYHARTNRAAELRASTEGLALIVAGRTHKLGAGDEAATWALSRPAFSELELAARFAHVPAATREALIALMLREQLIEPYQPQL